MLIRTEKDIQLYVSYLLRPGFITSKFECGLVHGLTVKTFVLGFRKFLCFPLPAVPRKKSAFLRILLDI